MARKNSVLVIALALAAGLVGYVLGPPIVQAATSTVKVASGSGGTQLKIAGSRALVDTEAATEPAGVLFNGQTILTSVDFGLILTQAGGQDVMATGSDSVASACPGNANGIIGAIVVDGATNAGPVKVTLTSDVDRNGTAGDLTWQGTVAPNGHLNDQMDGGILFRGPLGVTVSGTGTNWMLYGLCFSPSAAARSPVVKQLMNSPRLQLVGK